MILKDKSKDVGFVVIINTKDVENRYIEDNNLKVRARNRIFLLDKDNKIVIDGEPPSNKDIWAYYQKAFRELL